MWVVTPYHILRMNTEGKESDFMTFLWKKHPKKIFFLLYNHGKRSVFSRVLSHQLCHFLDARNSTKVHYTKDYCLKSNKIIGFRCITTPLSVRPSVRQSVSQSVSKKKLQWTYKFPTVTWILWVVWIMNGILNKTSLPSCQCSQITGLCHMWCKVCLGCSSLATPQICCTHLRQETNVTSRQSIKISVHQQF